MNCKERLTMHTPEGACLIINANNEIDARQELMEKFKLACNKLAELEDKLENGTLVELPFAAMINQHLVNGKFVPGNIQNKNGKYAIVYVDKSKWGSPLIDICGKKSFDKEEAEARLKELKENV